MRMAIASPGNDFRLGACEAPPAITSTYLGDSLTDYLEASMKAGSFKAYEPGMSHRPARSQDLGNNACC